VFTLAAVTTRFVQFPDDDCLSATNVEESTTPRVVASSEGRVFIVEVLGDRKWITWPDWAARIIGNHYSRLLLMNFLAVILKELLAWWWRPRRRAWS
jgi:hypothetical protein